MKAITQTTVFKKALKTVFDTLTATEQKEYDVGIGLQVDSQGGRLLLEHPVDPLIVTAEFPADLDGEEPVDCLFYLGELIDDLKHFRKKETLYIDARGELVLSVEDGMFYRADLDNERIAIPEGTSEHVVQKSDVIQMIGIAQAVTKTTFHPSSSVLQVVMNKRKLYGKATNFAQMAISELTLDTPVSQLTAFDIPAKWLTKLRYVLERDKKTGLTIRMGPESVTFLTETTEFSMERQEVQDGINAGAIMKQLTFEKHPFGFDLEQHETELKEQYKTLRQKEIDKADDIQKYQVIGFSVINHACTVIKENVQMNVPTRDMNAIIPKMTGEWIGHRSKEAMKLSQVTDGVKHTILIPYT